MKALTTLMVTALMVLGASLYLREDPFCDGRFRVYDENWQPKGYITKDRISPDKYRIYDEHWNRKGHIKKRSSDRWDFDKTD
ncbi:MAG: hypothetical protein JRF53_19115 [Deltaproteobacteria bacterium]|nr:hypothetical protein [Deltaproteobacteria bacterium]